MLNYQYFRYNNTRANQVKIIGCQTLLQMQNHTTILGGYDVRRHSL